MGARSIGGRIDAGLWALPALHVRPKSSDIDRVVRRFGLLVPRRKSNPHNLYPRNRDTSQEEVILGIYILAIEEEQVN